MCEGVVRPKNICKYEQSCCHLSGMDISFQVENVCANDGFDCHDGSDELCHDVCATKSFHGRFTMKVRFLPLSRI